MTNTTIEFPFGLLFIDASDRPVRAATEAEHAASMVTAINPTHGGIIYIDMLTRIDGDIQGGTVVRPVPCYVAPPLGGYTESYQLSMAMTSEREGMLNVDATNERIEILRQMAETDNARSGR